VNERKKRVRKRIPTRTNETTKKNSKKAIIFIDLVKRNLELPSKEGLRGAVHSKGLGRSLIRRKLSKVHAIKQLPY